VALLPNESGKNSTHRKID
jgi:hypothetical protein